MIEFQVAGGMKQIVAAMEGVCKNVTLDCSPDSVQIRGMDSAHIALISVVIKYSVCLHVYCLWDVVFCVNVNFLLKVLIAPRWSHA